MMKLDGMTVRKTDRRYVVLGVVSALVFVSILAAQAQAKQSAWVKVTQNGNTIFDSDFITPEEFFADYRSHFSGLDFVPTDEIKELSITPDEFKTTIEHEDGSTIKINRSTSHDEGDEETTTVVESDHASPRSTPSSHPTPSISSTPHNLEINDGNGTKVKKEGKTTTIDAPNVSIRLSGGEDEDNDVDIDIDHESDNKSDKFNYDSDD